MRPKARTSDQRASRFPPKRFWIEFGKTGTAILSADRSELQAACMSRYRNSHMLYKFFSLIVAVLCFFLPGSSASAKWIYGYASVGEGMWPLLVAQQKGFFSKNGVHDVEFVLIEGGLRGMSAVLGGDVH